MQLDYESMSLLIQSGVAVCSLIWQYIVTDTSEVAVCSLIMRVSHD